MSKKIIRYPLKIWLLASGSILVFLFLFLFGLHPFLSPTKRAKGANALVVEGWLPDYALYEAVKEFKTGNYRQLITTGGPLGPDYRVFIGGKLHFSIPDSLQQQFNQHPLTVEAFGSQIKGVSAHFTLWVNDTVFAGQTFTTSRRKKYEFPVDTSVKVIRSVHLHFDNDKMTATADRDLTISHITVNGRKIDYSYGGMRYEQHYPEGTKNMLVYPTYAQNAAAKLIMLGVDSQKVSIVAAPPAQAHKTYHAAMALKTYLLQHHIYTCNLLSVGVHTRRSWLTYEKALGQKFTIGSVAIENKSYQSVRWWQNKYIAKGVLRELAKYLYIRFWYQPPV